MKGHKPLFPKPKPYNLLCIPSSSNTLHASTNIAAERSDNTITLSNHITINFKGGKASKRKIVVISFSFYAKRVLRVLLPG